MTSMISTWASRRFATFTAGNPPPERPIDAVIEAVRHGDCMRAGPLIEANVPLIRYRDSNGDTLLHWAARAEFPDNTKGTQSAPSDPSLAAKVPEPDFLLVTR